MKKRFVLLTVFSVFTGLIAAVPAWAQTSSIEPGLWEHSFSMKGGPMEKVMADMQKQMAGMPADQRKMMESMMAKQGISMGKDGQSVKICITPQQAALQEPPPNDANCNQQLLQRGPNSMKMRFSCAGEHASNGEMEMSFPNKTSYAGKGFVNTKADGKPTRMDMVTSGKWLSANCGAVKPIVPPKP